MTQMFWVFDKAYGHSKDDELEGQFTSHGQNWI